MAITPAIFRLDCGWAGPAPRAGQFFMVKPERSCTFLPRPISAAFWSGASGDPPVAGETGGTLSFLILRKGKGTEELAALTPGETINLSGPLGNCWEDFLPVADGKPDGKTGLDTEKRAALIGGGIGIAPLLSLPSQYPGYFDFYAGFRTGFSHAGERESFFGAVLPAVRKLVLAYEEQSRAAPHGDTGKLIEHQGRIPDLLNPADYSAVYACGPEAMLRAVAEKCALAGTPCYVSLERRMACGTGACLGCTVKTAPGNRRCCTDGPIFPAKTIEFV